MEKMFKKFIQQHGKQICNTAAAMASIAPNCCRGHWYQPEEPNGLTEFLKERKSKNRR